MKVNCKTKFKYLNEIEYLLKDAKSIFNEKKISFKIAPLKENDKVILKRKLM